MAIQVLQRLYDKIKPTRFKGYHEGTDVLVYADKRIPSEIPITDVEATKLISITSSNPKVALPVRQVYNGASPLQSWAILAGDAGTATLTFKYEGFTKTLPVTVDAAYPTLTFGTFDIDTTESKTQHTSGTTGYFYSLSEVDLYAHIDGQYHPNNSQNILAFKTTAAQSEIDKLENYHWSDVNTYLNERVDFKTTSAAASIYRSLYDDKFILIPHFGATGSYTSSSIDMYLDGVLKKSYSVRGYDSGGMIVDISTFTVQASTGSVDVDANAADFCSGDCIVFSTQEGWDYLQNSGDTIFGLLGRFGCTGNIYRQTMSAKLKNTVNGNVYYASAAQLCASIKFVVGTETNNESLNIEKYWYSEGDFACVIIKAAKDIDTTVSLKLLGRASSSYSNTPIKTYTLTVHSDTLDYNYNSIYSQFRLVKDSAPTTPITSITLSASNVKPALIHRASTSGINGVIAKPFLNSILSPDSNPYSVYILRLQDTTSPYPYMDGRGRAYLLHLSFENSDDSVIDVSYSTNQEYIIVTPKKPGVATLKIVPYSRQSSTSTIYDARADKGVTVTVTVTA